MRNFGMLLLALALTGCTHRVQVALRPDYPNKLPSDNALATVKPPVSFARGEFTDKRGNTALLATFKQGVHTFNLYEQRPFADALYEGLEQLVKGTGHQWTTGEAADLRVNAQLLSLTAVRNAGFVNVSASATVQVKLDFVDRGQKVVYTQVYNGQEEKSKGLVGGMGMVTGALDEAIIDCLAAVGADQALANALKSVKAVASK